MNRFKKFYLLLILGIITVVLAAVPGTLVKAGLEEDAANAQKQIEEFKQKIAAADGNLLAIMSQISEINNNISTTEVRVNQLNQEIGVTQGNIENKENEINKALEEFNLKKKDYYASLRSKYEDGDIDFAGIVLNTVNLTDFVNYNEYYRIVRDKEQEKIDGLKKLKQTLEDQKKELEAMKNTLNDKKIAIESQKKQQDIEKQKLDSQKGYFATLSNDYQAELQKQEAALASINNQMQQAVIELQQARENQGNNSQNPGGRVDNGYQQGTGSFTWPVPGYYTITSPFGYRISPILGGGEFHKGIDIGAPGGVSIVAADSGVVVYAQFNNGGFGNCVIIDHGGGLISLYAHMNSRGVSYGQNVTKGQYIGAVGSTGWSTGNHLHFQVTNNGDIFRSVVDPMGYL